MCVCVHLHEFKCTMCLWELQEDRRGCWMPGVVTNSCEPPCRCWDLNPETLQEQKVTFMTEPPL